MFTSWTDLGEIESGKGLPLAQVWSKLLPHNIECLGCDVNIWELVVRITVDVDKWEGQEGDLERGFSVGCLPLRTL